MSYDTEVLKKLLKKVEAATGADPELDIELWQSLDPCEKAPGKVPLPWLCCYTSSIDAALALVERTAPRSLQWGEALRGATEVLSRRYSWHCAFSQPDQLPDLPLAILANLLRTLSNHGGNHEG